MIDKVRAALVGFTLAGVAAWGVMAPTSMKTALADEPAKAASKAFNEIFPKPFDPDTLRKFDIDTGPQVSTDVKTTATISKIGFGHRTWVSIVTTSSGTYSSDALTSPNVRYPGFDVTPKGHSRWSYRSFTGPLGRGSWTSFTRGSITYFTYSFTPTRRTWG